MNQSKINIKIFYLIKSSTILFLIFLSLSSLAQNDTIEIKNYLDSAKSIANRKNYALAFSYLSKSIDVSKKINSSSYLGKSYILRGKINEEQGKIKDACKDFENALEYLSPINDVEVVAEAYSKAGYLFGQMGKSAKALEYLFKGHRFVRKTSNIELHSKILSNISIIYFYTGKFEVAKTYILKAIEQRKRLLNKNGLSHLYGNLAMIYKKIDNDSSAIINYTKALKLCEVENDLRCVAKAYNNLGVFYQDKKQFNFALYHFKKSLEIAQENKFVDISLITSYNIATIYLETNKLDSVIFYANISFEGAKITNSFEDFAGAYELFYKYYEKKNDFKNALDFFKLYKTENDSLLLNSNSGSISNVELKNEFEQIELDRLIKEEKNKHKWTLELQKKEFESKLFFLSAASLLLFCILLFIYIQKSKKNNLKISKTNKELQETNREKDALMGIVAHDLRTPISQIKGLVKLLEMEEKLPKSQLEILENLNKAITHGDVLISELLELNNIENQKNIDFEVIDIKKVLNESIAQFEMQLKRKQLTLLSKIDIDVKILCREDWLYRIFNNFLSNAIKFSPYNKTVEVLINLIDNKTKVEVIIIDQGPGISPNEIPLLFKKFQRLSNKPTGDETTTGLGLFITKVIADKCNAKLFCESIVGVGTTFKVVFDVYKK